MFWLRLIYLRLYGLLRKNRIEQEMEDEMRFHLLMRTRDNIERGMRPDEAEVEARRRFGNVGRIKDLARDIKGGGFMETLLQDLRFGARMLLKHPGFTIIAIITLAAGIAANTVIFGVVNAVLLQPLPYQNPDQLVKIWGKLPAYVSGNVGASAPEFADYRDQNLVFSSIAAYDSSSFNLTGAGEPERIVVTFVSASLFPLLNVQPSLGRAFLNKEDRPGSDRVVILSHGLWQRRFASA